MTDEQRESVKDFVPFLVSVLAAAAMGTVIVATLFMGTGSQISERTAAASMPHAQHHIFSLR